jgi:hypothetical protein
LGDIPLQVQNGAEGPLFAYLYALLEIALAKVSTILPIQIPSGCRLD